MMLFVWLHREAPADDRPGEVLNLMSAAIDYGQNPVAGEAKYANRRVMVRGTVFQILKEGDAVRLVAAGESGILDCTMRQNQRGRIAELRAMEDSVEITGSLYGFESGSGLAKDCVLGRKFAASVSDATRHDPTPSTPPANLPGL